MRVARASADHSWVMQFTAMRILIVIPLIAVDSVGYVAMQVLSFSGSDCWSEVFCRQFEPVGRGVVFVVGVVALVVPHRGCKTVEPRSTI